jgi:hypothetical protein
MALTNAEKQERWRQRNRVVLRDDADEIAAKLITLDRRKLRKIVTLLTRHLKATTGLRKDAARNRAFQQEDERKWRKMWVTEGRALADYRAGLNDHNSAMWKWRSAHTSAAIERERQAWLEDHPGDPMPEHLCSLSDAEHRQYNSWMMGYEARPAKRPRKPRAGSDGQGL